MSGASTPVNPLELSDEDFLKLNAPPAAPAAGGGGEGDQGSDNNDDPNAQGMQPGEDDGAGGDSSNNDDDLDGTGEDDGTNDEEGEDGKKPDPAGDEDGEGGNLPSKDKSQEQDPTGKKSTEAKISEATSKDGKDKSGEGDGSQGDGKNPPGSKAEGQTAPPDYKAFYEKIMSPLKANGKTIDLKTPEEAVQLMQMGANYTRKMQAIAPHRKVLLMLENNGLLDEGKLSFLIDIEKKNPEAIKKLIKDSGLDPLEIDLDDPKAKPYLEGNHRVSDEEATFRTVLDELSSNPEGKTTLQTIQTQWDQASKEVLWKQPDVMQLIHDQRASGIYDRITTELERQRALGQIPPTVPFLHAYKAIGDQLAAAGGFDDLVKPAPNSQQQPEPKTPVATTVAKPKPAVKNGDKANAASSTRSNPREAKTVVNPLALSDEDFMKQVEVMQGRL